MIYELQTLKNYQPWASYNDSEKITWLKWKWKGDISHILLSFKNEANILILSSFQGVLVSEIQWVQLSYGDLNATYTYFINNESEQGTYIWGKFKFA